MFKVILFILLTFPLMAQAWHTTDVVESSCGNSKGLAFYCEGESQQKEVFTINKTTGETQSILNAYTHKLCVYLIGQEVSADYKLTKLSPLKGVPETSNHRLLTLAEDQDVSQGRMNFHFQTMHKSIWKLDKINFEFNLDTYSEIARIQFAAKPNSTPVVSSLPCIDLR